MKRIFPTTVSKILATWIVLLSAALLILGFQLPYNPNLEYGIIAGSCLLTLCILWLLARMFGQNAYDLVKNSNKRSQKSVFPRKNNIGVANLLHWSLHQRSAIKAS